MLSTRKTKPSCVRPGRERVQEQSGILPPLQEIPGKEWRCAHMPLHARRQPPRSPSGCVAHPVCCTLAEPGYCRKPTKRREGTRHFYDIFLQQAPNKPTWCWQGSQNPWGAVALQTSPFSGTMRQVHVAWRALGGGVSHPDSRGPAHCASQGSGGASRPSRDETSQPMLQFQTQDGMAISHTLTRGKGAVCPADCNLTWLMFGFFGVGGGVG